MTHPGPCAASLQGPPGPWSGAPACPAAPVHTGEHMSAPVPPIGPSAPPPALLACLGGGTSRTRHESRAQQSTGPPQTKCSHRDPAQEVRRPTLDKVPRGLDPTPNPLHIRRYQPAAETQCWPPRHQGHALLQVKELIDKVRAVFVDTLDELSWMDESSKKKAQEKVGRRPGRAAPVRWPWGDHHHTHFRERAMSGGWGSLRKGL